MPTPSSLTRRVQSAPGPAIPHGLSYGQILDDRILLQGHDDLDDDRATLITIALERRGATAIPRSISFAPYNSLSSFPAYTIRCAGNTAVQLVAVQNLLRQ